MQVSTALIRIEGTNFTSAIFASYLQDRGFLCGGIRADICNKNPNIPLLQKGYSHSLLIHSNFVQYLFLFCT